MISKILVGAWSSDCSDVINTLKEKKEQCSQDVSVNIALSSCSLYDYVIGFYKCWNDVTWYICIWESEKVLHIQGNVQTLCGLHLKFWNSNIYSNGTLFTYILEYFKWPLEENKSIFVTDLDELEKYTYLRGSTMFFCTGTAQDN